MTPEQHAQFLGALDEALETAIRRYRAVHHASLAELLEMQKEVSEAKDALERVVEAKSDMHSPASHSKRMDAEKNERRHAVGQ